MWSWRILRRRGSDARSPVSNAATDAHDRMRSAGAACEVPDARRSVEENDVGYPSSSVGDATALIVAAVASGGRPVVSVHDSRLVRMKFEAALRESGVDE